MFDSAGKDEGQKLGLLHR